MPPREKSPESVNGKKRLYSDKRDRGSRTTRTTIRTLILMTRSAWLRWQLKTFSYFKKELYYKSEDFVHTKDCPKEMYIITFL